MSTREIKIIKASQRVAYGVECAHCTRDSLTMTAAGVVSWKSPHGDHPHPNAVSIETLLRWAVEVLDPSATKGLRQIIDDRLSKSL